LSIKSDLLPVTTLFDDFPIIGIPLQDFTETTGRWKQKEAAEYQTLPLPEQQYLQVSIYLLLH
jgi:hypothetical protein